MHTIATADQVALTAPLAWHVIMQDRWAPGGAEIVDGGDSYLVYPEGDAQWIRPEDIAEREVFYCHMFTWEPKPTEHKGCCLLENPERVRNLLPLMDARCPTFSLALHLKAKGWTSSDRQCDHRTAALGLYDAHEAVKFKTYYQVLIILPTCLALTSYVPSRAPVDYYKLLLRGVKAEPGLRAKEYHRLLLECKDIVPFEHPPPSEDEGDVPIGDADAVDLVWEAKAKPAPKRRRLGEVHGAGSGAAAPPPVPLPPPPVPFGDPGGVPEPPGTPPPVDDEEVDLVPLADADERAPKRARRHVADFVPSIDGIEVKYEGEYRAPNADRPDTFHNWILRCPRHGNACVKKRHHTPRNTARFGSIEPLAFCHAWIPCDPKEGRSHATANPAPEAVAAVVAEHREELQRVVDLYGL